MTRLDPAEYNTIHVDIVGCVASEHSVGYTVSQNKN